MYLYFQRSRMQDSTNVLINFPEELSTNWISVVMPFVCLGLQTPCRGKRFPAPSVAISHVIINMYPYVSIKYVFTS